MTDEQLRRLRFLGNDGGICGLSHGDMKAIRAALTEIERLHAQHQHCDHCGGTWLDDGINAGCYCRAIERLRAALSEALREIDRLQAQNTTDIFRA